MTEPKPSRGRTLRRADSQRLTELARGLAKNEYLAVDVERVPEWTTSLMMIADGIVNVRNLGVILVPVGPHMGGYWINGRVPAVTLTCVLVAKGDMPELRRRLKEMNAALYPPD